MLRESRDIGARRKRCFQVLSFVGVVSVDQEGKLFAKRFFRCRLEPIRISRFGFYWTFRDSRFVCVKGVWDPPLLRF